MVGLWTGTKTGAPLVKKPDQPPASWKLRLVRHPLVDWLHFSTYSLLFGCHLESVPDLPSTPVIFAGNHGSHFDFLLLHECLCRKLKRPVRGVAWDEMAHMPGVRLLFYAYEGVPVSVGKTTLALRRLVQALHSGSDLWVQCEGARYDVLHPFQPGAAIASLMSASPIVPFSLRGVQPLFKNIPWPDRLWGNVSIRFHSPLYPRPYLERFGNLRTAADQMTADLRALVASGIDYPDGASR